MFAEGTQPTSGCTTHVWANVNRLNNRLATPSTPGFLTRKQVFIKKEHPNSATADFHVVLPSGYDDSTGGSYNYTEGDSNSDSLENNEHSNTPDTNVNDNNAANNTQHNNTGNNNSPAPTPPATNNNPGNLPTPDTNNNVNISPRTH